MAINELIEKAALALEKDKVKCYGWNKEEFKIWCYSDTRGRRSFADSVRTAKIVYNIMKKEAQ
jgi:hypothetical protein